LIGSEPVHISSMPDGSRIVKTFADLFSEYIWPYEIARWQPMDGSGNA
jgi:hypothetical protein